MPNDRTAWSAFHHLLSIEDPEDDAAEREQDFKRDEWGLAHHLSYVYLAVATAEEDELPDRELRRVATLLPDYESDPWLPDGLHRRMQIAFLEWMEQAIGADWDNHPFEFLAAQFATSIDYINREIPHDRRAAIVPDLLAFLDQEPRNFQRELIETLERSVDVDATEDSDTSGDAQDDGDHDVELLSPRAELDRPWLTKDQKRQIGYVKTAASGNERRR